jgi:hypothetical protein
MWSMRVSSSAVGVETVQGGALVLVAVVSVDEEIITE